uniref:Outer spore wall protein RRT8 n=1 Tax=Photinus pyralis TaxID=7054 RepID=A0A1Y1KW44_PHOPY
MADNSENGKSRSSRVANSVNKKAQGILKEDLDKAKGVAYQALKSKAYLYPIKGVFYFLSHKSLWQPFTSKIGSYLSLSAGVIGGMFAFTYLPQLAVLVFTSGPLAVFSTVLLVLNESSTITNIISRNWILQQSILDTFDGTLVSRNAINMVREGREVKSGSDPMKRLGKTLKSPFTKFSPTAIIRYIMYLPLNFIPVVGTAMFLFLQARTRGTLVHGRYFQLKNWSASQRREWLEKHTGAYTAFGFVATLLEMVPVANIFFTYTNTVGAALWAADIEELNTNMTDETAPTLREAAKKLQ